MKPGLRTFVIVCLLIVGCTDKVPEENADDIIAYRCRLNENQELVWTTEDKGLPLPEELIIKPGVYTMDSLQFDLRQEGLVRIMEIGSSNTQRIVFRYDTLALLSGLAWVITHGNADNNKSYDELEEKALTDKVFLTCGHTANWVVNLLRKRGIPAREVMILTLDKWNDYDNGHNMTEVYIGNKWLLFDIDHNKYFVTENGQADLRDFQKRLKDSTLVLKDLAADPVFQSGWENSDGYGLSFLSEMNSTDKESLLKWYGRNSNVILIEQNDSMYFQLTDKQEVNARILSYSSFINGIEPDEFERKFYH